MNDYLVEITPSHFHVFRNNPTTQDLDNKSLQTGGLVSVKYLYQKDGSRFKVLYAPKYTPYDVSKRMKEMFPGNLDLLIETKTTPEALSLLMQNPPESLIYRVYHTHTFLNAKRYVPLIIVPDIKTFYYPTSLFPDKVPEDDFGLLADSEDELAIHNTIPEVISYLSYHRLCHHCGIVSNHKKPKKNPWLSKKHL